MQAFGLPLACIFLLLFFMAAGLDLSSNIWLSGWSDDSLDNSSMSSTTRLAVYAAIGLSQGKERTTYE